MLTVVGNQTRIQYFHVYEATDKLDLGCCSQGHFMCTVPLYSSSLTAFIIYYSELDVKTVDVKKRLNLRSLFLF